MRVACPRDRVVFEDASSRLPCSSCAAASGAVGYADGPGATALFKGIQGVCVSPDGSLLYVADNLNNRLRTVNLATNEVATVAGGSSGFVDGVGVNQTVLISVARFCVNR